MADTPSSDRELLRQLAVALLRLTGDTPPEATPPTPPRPPGPQLVDLDQVAAVVGRTKKTLHRLRRRQCNPLPAPARPGRRGQQHLWDWSAIRPWLEAEFGRELPEEFPFW
jgi:hypothetical protein